MHKINMTINDRLDAYWNTNFNNLLIRMFYSWSFWGAAEIKVLQLKSKFECLTLLKMHKVNMTMYDRLDAYETLILTFFLLDCATVDPSEGQYKLKFCN